MKSSKKEHVTCDEGFVAYMFSMNAIELLGFVIRHPDYLDVVCSRDVIWDRWDMLAEAASNNMPEVDKHE